jgi:hypothetical protein
VVEYRTFGTAPDAAYALVEGEFVGTTAPSGNGKPFDRMTRDEMLASVAMFWAGWAAVHLAISRGLLPAEPTGVERRHGDCGFFGKGGSDDYWVRHFAERADPTDPTGFAEEARQLALEILRDEIHHFPDLAAEMDGVGILLADRLKELLA